MAKIDILKTLGVKKLVEPAFNAKRDEVVAELEEVLAVIQGAGVSQSSAIQLRQAIDTIKTWRL